MLDVLANKEWLLEEGYLLNTFTGCVPTGGGVITVRVEKRTAGQAVVNAIEFEWS